MFFIDLEHFDFWWKKIISQWKSSLFNDFEYAVIVNILNAFYWKVLINFEYSLKNLLVLIIDFWMTDLGSGEKKSKKKKKS